MKPEEKTARARERALTPSREAIIFAARCALLRRGLNMTQTEFAALLGRHWLTVSRWERIAGHLPSRQSMRAFEDIEKWKETGDER
jgi:DNA-binding transcriptional regulator YiaG